MKDPGIPRKNRKQGGSVRDTTDDANTTLGQLVIADDGVKLQSRIGKRWNAEEVRIVGGVMPRPWKYALDRSVILAGDDVVIEFLDENPKQPVITGILWPLKDSTDGRIKGASINDAADGSNQRVHRVTHIDASGAVVSNASIGMFDDGSRVEVAIGRGLGGVDLRFELNLDTLQIKIGKGMELVGVPLGDKTAQAFTDICADLATIGAGLTVPIAPALLQTFQLSIDAAVSSGSGGAPLLSDVVKVE